VEQCDAGRIEGVGSPAKVDSGSTAEIEGDHVAGLKEECRPGGTWAEHHQEAHIEASSSSPTQYEHGKCPPTQWRHSQARSWCSPKIALGAPEARD
jgi:hypothetical protein